VVSRFIPAGASDLVAGSGLYFDERGRHLLKGYESRWTSMRYRIDGPSPAEGKPQGARIGAGRRGRVPQRLLDLTSIHDTQSVATNVHNGR
jgi:hypothetical protein